MAKKLMDEIRKTFRLHHYSYRTEESYVKWIKRFILFHKKRHPREMDPDEIQQFLRDLAVRGKVSASTQNQALSALLFLWLESGYDIHTVQELMGHTKVNTTMIYTHVLKRGGRAVHSPLDSVLSS